VTGIIPDMVRLRGAVISAKDVGCWQCAPKARTISEGGSHPDNCRSIPKLATSGLVKPIGALSLMSGGGKPTAGHRPQVTAPTLDLPLSPLRRVRTRHICLPATLGAKSCVRCGKQDFVYLPAEDVYLRRSEPSRDWLKWALKRAACSGWTLVGEAFQY